LETFYWVTKNDDFDLAIKALRIMYKFGSACSEIRIRMRINLERGSE
jgi:hypothetical protein